MEQPLSKAIEVADQPLVDAAFPCLQLPPQVGQGLSARDRVTQLSTLQVNQGKPAIHLLSNLKKGIMAPAPVDSDPPRPFSWRVFRS